MRQRPRPCVCTPPGEGEKASKIVRGGGAPNPALRSAVCATASAITTYCTTEPYNVAKKRTAQAVAFFFFCLLSLRIFALVVGFSVAKLRFIAAGGNARSCLVSSKEVNFLRTQKSVRGKIQASGAASTLSIFCSAHTQFP